MKTKESRFQVHDELTAPERSVPGPQGRARGRRPAPQLPRRARRRPGGAARLRALPLGAAARHAPRPDRTADRAGRGRAPGQRVRAGHARSAPRARPGWASTRSRSPASSTRATSTRRSLLRYVKALLESDGPPQLHLHEEAREAGWTDEQILEAVAHVALSSFANLVTRAADVPEDGSAEESRLAPGRLSVDGDRSSPSTLKVMVAATQTAAGSTSGGPAQPCCTALPPGRRAGRQALDRRDPVRPDGRPAALLRDQAPGARPLRPAAVRAAEGAGVRGHRRTPGVQTAARPRASTRSRQRARRSSPPCGPSSPGPVPTSAVQR